MAATQTSVTKSNTASIASASPSSTAVGSAISNSHPGSNVSVSISDIVLHWEIQNNSHGDALPIIPTSSRVEHGRVLYQLLVKVTLTQVSGRGAVYGKTMTIKSSRSGDVITPSVLSSGEDGTLQFTLRGRDPGDRHLSVEDSDITAEPLSINLKDAWYESTFLVTGYNVCNESDFSGDLTDAIGLEGQHRYNFLFSASGVIMQGTGMALNGRYVRFVRMTTTWHLNDRTHHRDHIQDPTQVTFAYTDSVQGAYGRVRENRSIAVDKRIIPPGAHVNIEGVGDRYADDTGSAINDYHIDNFLGAGAAVVQTWLHGGINGTQRSVKYIGN